MKRFWPLAVVGLIGTAFVANMTLLYLATADPGFAVEPDYYAQALAWDERRVQERVNTARGWTLDLTVDPAPSADGSQRLEIRLLDAAAVGIGDASVKLTAFHNARSNDVQQAELREGQDGAYDTTLRFRRAGLWEFRIEARRGDDFFTRTLIEDVPVQPFRPVTGGR